MKIERSLPKEITDSFEAIFLDLDDTILDTNDVFKRKYQRYFLFCKKLAPDLDIQKFQEDFISLDNEMVRKYGVAENRWPSNLRILCELYKSDFPMQGLPIIQSIYDTAPRLIPGAIETLEAFREAGLRLGLITHASERWTNIKLAKRGLFPYFEHIKIVDPQTNQYKEAKHWRELIELFGIDPSKIISVGDSRTGDALASLSAGILQALLLPSPWSLLSEGDSHQGIIETPSIAQVIPTLAMRIK